MRPSATGTRGGFHGSVRAFLVDRHLQHGGEPADADRAPLHAADLRPRDPQPVRGDAARADRAGHAALPDHGHARLCPRPGGGADRRDGADPPRRPGVQRLAAPGGALERALEALDRAQGSRGGAAARRLAGAFRRLRHALGAVLPPGDLQLPSLSRPSRGGGHAAAGPRHLPQPAADPQAGGRGPRCHDAGRRLRRDHPPAERDGRRARDARRGARRAGRGCAPARSTPRSPPAIASASSRRRPRPSAISCSR